MLIPAIKAFMMQASKGVAFAAFELKVDALMALAINHTDLLPMVNAAVNASAPFISAIAFRYNNLPKSRSQQADLCCVRDLGF